MSSSLLSYLSCGYCCPDSSDENTNHTNAPAKAKKSLMCGEDYYQNRQVVIHLGNTVYLKNSSIPMLEVTLEFESENEKIMNNDILYVMSENQKQMPSSLIDLDPKRKIAIERSDWADNIGRAVIHLSILQSNGIYLVRYLRIQEPVTLTAKCAILGTSEPFFFQKTPAQQNSNAKMESIKRDMAQTTGTTPMFNNSIQELLSNGNSKPESTAERSHSTSLCQADNDTTHIMTNTNKSFLDSRQRSQEFLQGSQTQGSLKKLLAESLNNYDDLFKSSETPDPAEQEFIYGSPSGSSNNKNNSYQSPTNYLNQWSAANPAANRLFTVEEVNSTFSGEQGIDDFRFNKRHSIQRTSSRVYISHLVSERPSNITTRGANAQDMYYIDGAININNNSQYPNNQRLEVASRISCNSEKVQKEEDSPGGGQRISMMSLKKKKRYRSITAEQTNKDSFSPQMLLQEDPFHTAEDLMEVEDEQDEDDCDEMGIGNEQFPYICNKQIQIYIDDELQEYALV